MLDAAVWSAIALMASGVATLALRVRPLPLVPLTLALLHILLLQTCILAVGLGGHLNARGLHGALALLGALALAACALGCGPLRAEWRLWRARLVRIRAIDGAVTQCALAAFVALSATIGFLCGPFVGDAVRGYLLPAADWVAHGRIFDAGWIDPVGYRPQGHGLLAAMWMAGTGRIRGAPLAGMHWMLVLWAGAWAMARQAGAGPRLATWSVAATLAIPILWAMSTSGLADLPVAACLVGAMACLIGPRIGATQLALAALAILIGCGAKYSILPPALVLIAIAVLRSSMFRLKATTTIGRSAMGAWIPVLLLALSLAGSGYIANLVRYGNPVYPWTPGGFLFGHRGADAGGYLSSRLRMHYELIAEGLWDRHGFFDALTPHGTGFGPLAAAMGIPALVALSITRRRFHPLALSTLALFYAMILFGAGPQVWAGRFFAFLTVPLVVAGVCITPRLAGPWARRAWVVMLIACAMWGIGVGVYHLPHGLAWEFWRERGRLVPLSPAMYDPNLESERDTLAALVALPPDARIAIVNSLAESYLLLLHGESPSRRFTYLYPATEPGHGAVTPHACAELTPRLVAQWKATGITHIVALTPADRQAVGKIPQAHPLTGGVYALE